MICPVKTAMRLKPWLSLQTPIPPRANTYSEPRRMPKHTATSTAQVSEEVGSHCVTVQCSYKQCLLQIYWVSTASHSAIKKNTKTKTLEIFQTLLDKVLCSLLWVTLLRQGVGLGDPQRSLPTPAMLGFYECDNC